MFIDSEAMLQPIFIFTTENFKGKTYSKKILILEKSTNSHFFGFRRLSGYILGSHIDINILEIN